MILPFESVCDAAEMFHQQSRDAGVDLRLLDGARHAQKPSIPLGGANLNMPVHFANVGMPVFLDIELRAAEESGQEIELLDARMGDAMPAQMQKVQDFRRGIGFYQILENSDEPMQNRRAADPLIEAFVSRHCDRPLAPGSAAGGSPTRCEAAPPREDLEPVRENAPSFAEKG